MELDYPYILVSILIMALVTYVSRMLPLAVFQKKIRNPFIKSFLAYVPYAVLAAMAFPGILFSTASVYSAVVGLLVVLVLSYFNKGLLLTALGSVAAVFVIEQLLPLLPLA